MVKITRMKNCITLALILFVNIAFAQSEKYYVTFVKGQTTLKKTNKPLKVGDVLLSTDALVFKDQNAKVSCISPGKGRFDITAQKTKASPTGELLAVLKNNLVPATNTYHLSSRSLVFEGYDPKTYFQSTETNDRILLFANEPFPIVPSYKTDDANFFFIQYLNKGKIITKKIDQTENGLLFNANLFMEGNPEKVMLCYQTLVAGKAKSSSITEFIPITVNKSDLLNEIQVIKTSLGNNKKLVKEAVTAHIFDNYGKLSSDQIDKLVN